MAKSSPKNNFELDRDAHVKLVRTGGFAGHRVVLADVTLDKLSDDDFKTVKQIIGALRALPRKANRICDGFNYHIATGAKDTASDKLTNVFNSGATGGKPREIAALEEILVKAAAPKKGPRQG